MTGQANEPFLKEMQKSDLCWSAKSKRATGERSRSVALVSEVDQCGAGEDFLIKPTQLGRTTSI
jgi:hypothetical protein